MPKSPFELFLEKLAKVLLFSSLGPDSNGVCLIEMKEGRIPLLFEFDDQLVPYSILVSTPLYAFPLTHRYGIYQICLMGNGEMEETLSVKPDEDLLYLHRRIHPEIDIFDLDLLLKNFLEKVKDWKDQAVTLCSQPPEILIPHPSSSIQVFPYKA